MIVDVGVRSELFVVVCDCFFLSRQEEVVAFDWKVVAVSDSIVFAVIVEAFSLASEVRVYCDWTVDMKHFTFPKIVVYPIASLE